MSADCDDESQDENEVVEEDRLMLCARGIELVMAGPLLIPCCRVKKLPYVSELYRINYFSGAGTRRLSTLRNIIDAALTTRLPSRYVLSFRRII